MQFVGPRPQVPAPAVSPQQPGAPAPVGRGVDIGPDGRAKHMTPLLKPIVRKTDRPFMHYRTPLVVTLLPGDVISLRLLRHKREVVFNLHTLYYQGLQTLEMQSEDTSATRDPLK